MSFLTILKEEQTFTGKDGITYTLTPLNLRDLGKFVSWVQFKPYRDAIEADIPEDRLKEIYEDCKRGKVREEVSKGVFEEFDINIHSTIVSQAMQDIEGLIKLFEFSLQKKHHNKKFEDVCDEDTLVEIQNQLLEVTFGNPPNEEPEKN